MYSNCIYFYVSCLREKRIHSNKTRYFQVMLFIFVPLEKGIQLNTINKTNEIKHIFVHAIIDFRASGKRH